MAFHLPPKLKLPEKPVLKAHDSNPRRYIEYWQHSLVRVTFEGDNIVKQEIVRGYADNKKAKTLVERKNKNKAKFEGKQGSADI